MEIGMFTYHREIETRLQVYNCLLNRSQQFRDRFIPDPLSMLIVSNTVRQFKLEVLFLALTLLRYSDCKKVDIPDFLGNNSQIILQGKTKEKIEVPPLFLSESPLHSIVIPAVTLFTDSYAKIQYALLNAIPGEIKQSMQTQRSVTHIFRFLRASYFHIMKKDYYLISRYLGHKDPESLASYMPADLLNHYSSYLSKV